MTPRGRRLTKGRSLRQTCFSHALQRLHWRPPVMAADTPLMSLSSMSLGDHDSRLHPQSRRSMTLRVAPRLHSQPQPQRNRGRPCLPVPRQPHCQWKAVMLTGPFPRRDPRFPRCRL